MSYRLQSRAVQQMIRGCPPAANDGYQTMVDPSYPFPGKNEFVEDSVFDRVYSLACKVMPLTHYFPGKGMLCRPKGGHTTYAARRSKDFASPPT